MKRVIADETLDASRVTHMLGYLDRYVGFYYRTDGLNNLKVLTKLRKEDHLDLPSYGFISPTLCGTSYTDPAYCGTSIKECLNKAAAERTVYAIEPTDNLKIK